MGWSAEGRVDCVVALPALFLSLSFVMFDLQRLVAGIS
jgi:hypothetical protein